MFYWIKIYTKDALGFIDKYWDTKNIIRIGLDFAIKL